MIESCTSIQHAGWLELRRALWPECSDDEHREEMAEFLAEPEHFAQYIAFDEDQRPVGFVEASIRTDYVNGTETSPVGFLEGIYVSPEFRRRGFGRELVAEVERWAIAHGCRELSSDADLENLLSHDVHRALGFDETERVVYFRKELGHPAD